MTEEVKKYEGLLGCKTQPMNDDVSKLFFMLCCIERDMEFGQKPSSTPEEMAKSLEGDLGYGIMKSRLAEFKKRFSPTLQVEILPQIFCTMICDRPGQVVMWAYTLNEIFVKTGQPVNLASLANQFPWGFPTPEAYEACWDAQKGMGQPLGNMVDDFKNWSKPKEKEDEVPVQSETDKG